MCIRDSIREDANWLLNMVENLLTVTRIRDDSASVNKSLEPVEEVMAEAVYRLKKRIPDAQIKVLLPEEFVMIPMDATLIEQVLINLMENAIFHAGSTEPVAVSYTHLDVYKRQEHGSLDGQTSWKVLKGTEWSEITVPTVTADTDYRHTGWSQALPDAEYQVAEDMTFTALYELSLIHI